MLYPRKEYKAVNVVKVRDSDLYRVRIIYADDHIERPTGRYYDKVDAECVAYAIKRGRMLKGTDIDIRDFIAFYGCEYCMDALTNDAEPLYMCDGRKAYICPHKECPYAEAIESEGGWPAIMKTLRPVRDNMEEELA